MSWWKTTKRMSDEEIVERARKNLEHVERWGQWWVAMHWTGAIVWLATFAAFGFLVQGWANNMAQNPADLWLGAIFGLLAGASAYHVSHGVIQAMLSRLPDERDRLLLKYHDALIEFMHANGVETRAAEE